MLKAEPDAGQHVPQVGHDSMGLGHDTFGQHAGRVGRIRHLAGDEDEAIGLDRMAERRNGFRAAGNHVKFHQRRLVSGIRCHVANRRLLKMA